MSDWPEIDAVLAGASDGCVVCADCMDVLPQLPRRSCGVCVMDPPYMFTTASSGSGKLNPWADMMNAALWFRALLEVVCRVCEDGIVWQFCSWRTLATLQKAAYDARLSIESFLIWDKQWIAAGGNRGLRPSYETIALLLPGTGKIKDRSIPDITRCQWSAHKPNGHPAEKPEDLCLRLIEWAGKPPVVLDPFCGSGTSLVAAARLGCRAIGIECDPEWADRARRRLAATPKPLFTDPPDPPKPQPALFDQEAPRV